MRALEMAGVDRDRAALVIGHERGFTFRVYNPEGLDVTMLREVVEAVRYERLDLSRRCIPQRMPALFEVQGTEPQYRSGHHVGGRTVKLTHRSVLLGSVALFGIGLDGIGMSLNAVYAYQFDPPPVTVVASGGGADVATIDAVMGDEISAVAPPMFRIVGPAK